MRACSPTGQDSPARDSEFNRLALRLFALQFEHNRLYRRFCEATGATPASVTGWREIPAVPSAGFKEADLTCLARDERTHVFFSSGTTAQKRSRHVHSGESLAIYEASVWAWFEAHLAPEETQLVLILLTPPPQAAPNSSLVHMLDTVRQKLARPASAFTGTALPDGSWEINFPQAIAKLESAQPEASRALVLGTAFSFVHLLDELEHRGLAFRLPTGSGAMETGGYKGRSRAMSKEALHARIASGMGLPRVAIVSEYGMSELGSQAYDTRVGAGGARALRFPPWARSRVVSPETGIEVSEGEVGLIHVLDLANVYSAMHLQTEDMGIRRGDGFEMAGRAALSEPRGCSLQLA